MTSEKEPSGWLSAEFEASRPHLQAMASRMLSSRTEAEDALQEAWLKVTRADAASVGNLRGWLTAVVARVCLDMLRSRKARHEQAGDSLEDAVAPGSAEPEQRAALADSVGAALSLVLETLTPNERLAFVLHDSFDLSFDEIADILGTTTAASRQLASRARRRVRGGPNAVAEEPDPARQREVVEAFLVASRTGDLAALMRVLHPAVVMRADEHAVAEGQKRKAQGAPVLAPETRGAAVVAGAFLGRASAAQVALIEGRVGAVWAPQGKPRSALLMTVAAGQIVAIDIVAEPAELAALEIRL
ncbi:MAG: sigma-70 family RNA polymerase sigma factor [Myxococcales bacterium]|nr:MAG: sigma-70 family RNA polymerase sigma factor [Myxococcales bacterium]